RPHGGDDERHGDEQVPAGDGVVAAAHGRIGQGRIEEASRSPTCRVGRAATFELRAKTMECAATLGVRRNDSPMQRRLENLRGTPVCLLAVTRDASPGTRPPAIEMALDYLRDRSAERVRIS